MYILASSEIQKVSPSACLRTWISHGIHTFAALQCVKKPPKLGGIVASAYCLANEEKY